MSRHFFINPQSGLQRLLIAIALSACLVIGLIAIFISVQRQVRSDPIITFFGATVAQNVSIYYSEIIDVINLDQKINKSLCFVRSSGTPETHLYTGVSLWDLIVYSGVTYGAATAIRFIGSDAKASPAFPLKLVQQNPELVLLAYEQDGTSLIANVDGPYETIVNHSVVAPKISGNYACKKVVSIEFLNYPDWNITIFGNVKENITIFYSELMTYGYTILNELINYSNSIRNYTGISVKQILSKELPSNYMFNTTPIGNVTFIGAYSWVSQSVDYNWVVHNETNVLVVYARDGVLLFPTIDGYLNSVVDYSLTGPTKKGLYIDSEQFKAKYLLYIQISGI